MNFKTTITLAIAAIAGGALWLLYVSTRPAQPSSESISIIEKELTPQKLTRIHIAQADHKLDLERSPGGDWTLPGGWPTRPPAVAQLVNVLTSLRSRFGPIPVSAEGDDLAGFGLGASQEPVQITVHAGDSDYNLQLGEEPGDSNRFSRPTYLRLKGQNEVLRLRPGLVADITRPTDYYQQHKLFPSDRVVEAESSEKSERVVARSVAARAANGNFTLTQAKNDWGIEDPVRDRVDPDKLKAILQAVPDIWAEEFVNKPGTDLAEYGLKQPEQTLSVTKMDGSKVNLLIGKQSQMKTRTVTRPSPPGPPGMPPQPPRPETIHEEYRYAKLQGNDQIFEIKADKLKSIFVPLDTLRDPRLARFRSDDARQVEINYGGNQIVLAKDKERWRLVKPIEGDAETGKITELLDKLSGLEAKDKDILDKADPKSYSLEPPAGTIRINVEESKGEGENKAVTKKTFTFEIGKDDKEKSKAYIKVQGWPRIDLVEDNFLTLVKRPPLVYRGRRVLEFFSTDLAKIEVHRAGDNFVMEQEKDAWQLASPVKANADSSKANKLADDLGRLEAVEYVANATKPAELETAYGLAKPALSATLVFSKKEKPAQTLLIGKERTGKPEYFAKLASSAEVFVIKKEIRDLLDQNSLAYRPQQPWQIKPEEIVDLLVQKQGETYRVKREGNGWRVLEPFQAAALPAQVQPAIDDLANLKTDRYESHVAKELASYGLDKPYLRVVVTASPPKEADQNTKVDPAKPAPKKNESSKEHVLLVGKPTGKDVKSRFAKLGDSEAVFVINEKTVSGVDHSALDLLDRNLLSLDSASVTQIKTQMGTNSTTLTREKETWRVESSAAKFTADREAVASLLGQFNNLRAERFAAYGSKVNLATYGLDKPTETITITAKPGPDGKPAAKNDHVVTLGKPVPQEAGSFYARLDQGPGVAVLAGPTSSELQRTYLDFVDRTMLKFDASTIAILQRHMGGQELEVARRDGSWSLLKPSAAKADGATLDKLVAELASLRALRMAAYPAKDLKPYGFESPAAVLTLRQEGPSAAKAAKVIRLGKLVKENDNPRTGDRFVMAEGSTAIGVLAGELCSRLLAPPLQFRDRGLARFTDVDRIILERGPRKAVLNKVEGTWKVAVPLEAETEQTDLEEFINSLARLRADELVAEKPADLQIYGLDKPAVHWSFLSADKEVLGLFVGAVEKTTTSPGAGKRRYARLASGSLVFLLDPRLTTKAMTEYRSRTVWTTLDAAQIESLHYDNGPSSFTLEKKDNNWHLASKPEAKIKSTAVTETLDALARLRAERFVVDKDADMKLFGLEPPQIIVEIQSPSGKRALQIGRTEGNSKRYYARIPEGNRSDVFVIGDAEANQIVRALSAFIEAPGKSSVAAPPSIPGDASSPTNRN